MKTAGVRELKARLSSYLRDVQRGEILLVTDNGRIVAELRPPGSDAKAAPARYSRLVAAGVLRLGSAPLPEGWGTALDRPLPDGSVRRLVDEDRDE
jgi:antitoxin (DNA-binding transcriptional repressor) of toxin-antitoxin stability system